MRFYCIRGSTKRSGADRSGSDRPADILFEVSFGTHLSAAACLRIRALRGPSVAVSLVNVPLVFHHGHHKRHLDQPALVSAHSIPLRPSRRPVPFLTVRASSCRSSPSVSLESSNSVGALVVFPLAAAFRLRCGSFSSPEVLRANSTN